MVPSRCIQNTSKLILKLGMMPLRVLDEHMNDRIKRVSSSRGSVHYFDTKNLVRYGAII